jgi:hypothetical protein
MGENRPPAARPRVGGTGGYALGEWATSNAGCAFLATILAACDPIGYGYVNQLHQAVALVHHVGNTEKRLTLAAGERRPPQLGDRHGQDSKTA